MIIVFDFLNLSTSKNKLWDTVSVLGTFENLRAQFRWLCDGDIQVRFFLMCVTAPYGTH
jgi:hypothetical protein